jgi:arylsulfatase
VFPLVDSLVSRVTGFIPPPNPPGARCVFRPDASPATDESVPFLVGGFTMTALVETPERDQTEGMLCALGDWNAGFAFFVRGGRLTFVVNAAGEISRVVADTPLPEASSRTIALACEFVPHGSGGTFTLTCDDVVVGHAESVHPVPLTWQHGGGALRLGRDAGFPVCDDYEVPFPWTGTLHEVVIEVPGPTRPDPQTELRDALRRD